MSTQEKPVKSGACKATKDKRNYTVDLIALLIIGLSSLVFILLVQYPLEFDRVTF
jgi:hypothetical protein